MDPLLNGVDEVQAAPVRVGGLVKQDADERGVVADQENCPEEVEGVLGDDDAATTRGDDRPFSHGAP